MNNVTATSDAGAGSGPSDTEPRSYFTNLVIRWTFAADINATQAADAQFQSLESALESADGDIRDAMHLMMHQTGNTATSAASDLLASAQSGVEVDKQAKLLRTALSTYASAMDVVRSRYEELMSEAIMNRVMVSGDYRSCTLHVEYDESDPFAPYFESLKGKVQTIESLYKLAEKEFADALGKVNTNDLVQLANEGVDYTKSSLIPSSDNYFWTGIGPLSAWTELGGNSAHGARSWWHRAKYKEPKNFANLSPWKRFTAKGDLSNYTMYGKNVAGNTSRFAEKIAGAAGKASKVLGPAAAFADAGLTAYDSYRSDSINYPKMGEGEKIARAGVKGSLSAGGAFVGAKFGAEGGAAIGGCVGGPVGAVVGGFAGGLIGGFAGSKLGQSFGDWTNRNITKPFAKWWNS